ncbi:hypothetical protein SAMN05421736_101229 [Evansella caseinilytica]|uniref:Gluconate 2-dehydrogenase subunit 3-like protein n=1 Tax=Evansella caseinilytica TaxID=1503961 RepID=A0A1H3GNY6_9BACI|nr:hypothetical protein [Evansella caseinilytica]SDY04827.1 hypothetical protein SAMN05421736_101229 [Evansella caseinilytica]
MRQAKSTATTATFYALVDSIIPNTPQLASKLGQIHSVGATDMDTHAYLIYQLDHFLNIHVGFSLFEVPLSEPTAELLNAAAGQVIETGSNVEPLHHYLYVKNAPFTMLSRTDRLRSVTLMERLQVDLSRLPVPFQHNGGLVQFMMDTLNRLIYFGYYSEWAGYGATRLYSPDWRKLEFFPVSWLQAGYPGPAYGYRAYRGHLLKYPRKGEEEHVR